ncbi:MAG: hypothetical protein IKM43_01790 [Clostridia bacterium]|nr:hypothetical protein [Clostridia bacterium]
MNNTKTKLAIKYIVSFLVTMLIIVSCIGIYFATRKDSIPQIAKVNPIEFATDTWDGKTKDESKWLAGKSYAKRGDNTYTINSAESFAYFVYLVNNGETFEGYTIYLNKNIDMQGHFIQSIGSLQNPFKGTFDGQYYAIYNAKIDGNGLFGYTNGATIKNIGLYNCFVYTKGEIAGGIVATALNTNISNTFVRLGNITGGYMAGGIVGKYISNNGAHKIENSFVDTQINSYYVGGIVAEIFTNHTASNMVTMSYCYHTNGNAYSIIDDINNIDSIQVDHANKTNFNIWSYSPSYTLKKLWCNYSYADGSTPLSFNYPILSRFNKVFLTGSCFENVIIKDGVATEVETMADAFDVAGDEKSEINIIVEKVFVDQTAVADGNSYITLTTSTDTTLVRSGNNTDAIVKGTDLSSLVIGDIDADETTPVITFDGQKDYAKANNIQTDALVVSSGYDFVLNKNVKIQNNINNKTGYGGGVSLIFPYKATYTSTDEISAVGINGATITNCESAKDGGGAYIGGTFASLGASLNLNIYNCMSHANGGGLAIDRAYKFETQQYIQSINTIYGGNKEINYTAEHYGEYNGVDKDTTITGTVSNQISEDPWAPFVGSSSADYNGGGIYINANGHNVYFGTENASLTVSNCKANKTDGIGGDGGGIYVTNAKTVNASNLTISGCTSNDGNGGGIFIASSGSVSSSSLTISGCSAYSTDMNSSERGNGGGIYVNACTQLLLSNATLSGNFSNYSGSAIYSTVKTTINNTTKINRENSSGNGTIFISNNTLDFLGNCSGNKSTGGAGIVAYYSTINFNGTISGNIAIDSNDNAINQYYYNMEANDGIYLKDSTLNISGGTITGDNPCNDIYLDYNSYINFKSKTSIGGEIYYSSYAPTKSIDVQYNITIYRSIRVCLSRNKPFDFAKSSIYSNDNSFKSLFVCMYESSGSLAKKWIEYNNATEVEIIKENSYYVARITNAKKEFTFNTIDNATLYYARVIKGSSANESDFIKQDNDITLTFYGNQTLYIKTKSENSEKYLITLEISDKTYNYYVRYKSKSEFVTYNGESKECYQTYFNNKISIYNNVTGNINFDITTYENYSTDREQGSPYSTSNITKDQEIAMYQHSITPIFELKEYGIRYQTLILETAESDQTENIYTINATNYVFKEIKTSSAGITNTISTILSNQNISSNQGQNTLTIADNTLSYNGSDYIYLAWAVSAISGKDGVQIIDNSSTNYLESPQKILVEDWGKCSNGDLIYVTVVIKSLKIGIDLYYKNFGEDNYNKETIVFKPNDKTMRYNGALITNVSQDVHLDNLGLNNAPDKRYFDGWEIDYANTAYTISVNGNFLTATNTAGASITFDVTNIENTKYRVNSITEGSEFVQDNNNPLVTARWVDVYEVVVNTGETVWDEDEYNVPQNIGVVYDTSLIVIGNGFIINPVNYSELSNKIGNYVNAAKGHAFSQEHLAGYPFYVYNYGFEINSLQFEIIQNGSITQNNFNSLADCYQYIVANKLSADSVKISITPLWNELGASLKIEEGSNTLYTNYNAAYTLKCISPVGQSFVAYKNKGIYLPKQGVWNYYYLGNPYTYNGTNYLLEIPEYDESQEEHDQFKPLYLDDIHKVYLEIPDYYWSLGELTIDADSNYRFYNGDESSKAKFTYLDAVSTIKSLYINPNFSNGFVDYTKYNKATHGLIETSDLQNLIPEFIAQWNNNILNANLSNKLYLTSAKALNGDVETSLTDGATKALSANSAYIYLVNGVSIGTDSDFAWVDGDHTNTAKSLPVFNMNRLYTLRWFNSAEKDIYYKTYKGVEYTSVSEEFASTLDDTNRKTKWQVIDGYETDGTNYQLKLELDDFRIRSVNDFTINTLYDELADSISDYGYVLVKFTDEVVDASHKGSAMYLAYAEDGEMAYYKLFSGEDAVNKDFTNFKFNLNKDDVKKVKYNGNEIDLLALDGNNNPVYKVDVPKLYEGSKIQLAVYDQAYDNTVSDNMIGYRIVDRADWSIQEYQKERVVQNLTYQSSNYLFNNENRIAEGQLDFYSDIFINVYFENIVYDLSVKLDDPEASIDNGNFDVDASSGSVLEQTEIAFDDLIKDSQSFVLYYNPTPAYELSANAFTLGELILQSSNLEQYYGFTFDGTWLRKYYENVGFSTEDQSLEILINTTRIVFTINVKVVDTSRESGQTIEEISIDTWKYNNTIWTDANFAKVFEYDSTVGTYLTKGRVPLESYAMLQSGNKNLLYKAYGFKVVDKPTIYEISTENALLQMASGTLGEIIPEDNRTLTYIVDTRELVTISLKAIDVLHVNHSHDTNSTVRKTTISNGINNSTTFILSANAEKVASDNTTYNNTALIYAYKGLDCELSSDFNTVYYDDVEYYLGLRPDRDSGAEKLSSYMFTATESTTLYLHFVPREIDVNVVYTLDGESTTSAKLTENGIMSSTVSLNDMFITHQLVFKINYLHTDYVVQVFVNTNNINLVNNEARYNLTQSTYENFAGELDLYINVYSKDVNAITIKFESNGQSIEGYDYGSIILTDTDLNGVSATKSLISIGQNLNSYSVIADHKIKLNVSLTSAFSYAGYRHEDGALITKATPDSYPDRSEEIVLFEKFNPELHWGTYTIVLEPIEVKAKLSATSEQIEYYTITSSAGTITNEENTLSIIGLGYGDIIYLLVSEKIDERFDYLYIDKNNNGLYDTAELKYTAVDGVLEVTDCLIDSEILSSYAEYIVQGNSVYYLLNFRIATTPKYKLEINGATDNVVITTSPEILKDGQVQYHLVNTQISLSIKAKLHGKYNLSLNDGDTVLAVGNNSNEYIVSYTFNITEDSIYTILMTPEQFNINYTEKHIYNLSTGATTVTGDDIVGQITVNEGGNVYDSTSIITLNYAGETTNKVQLQKVIITGNDAEKVEILINTKEDGSIDITGTTDDYAVTAYKVSGVTKISITYTTKNNISIETQYISLALISPSEQA